MSLISLPLALLMLTQNFTQQGYVEARSSLYPEAAVNDRAHAVNEMQFRYEAFYKPRFNFQIAAAVDLRADTHHQTDREWRVDWKDRERQRPLLSLRRLSTQYRHRGFTLETGKQFVHWGRTHIINPTDRLAPRDYLAVVDNEYLGIYAVRGTYERGENTFEAVWTPRFTPSRVPLSNQRWLATAPGMPALAIERDIPEGSQVGIRWSRVGVVEFGAAYFTGFSHLPSYETPAGKSVIREFYSRQQMIGGDMAVPLRWLSLKTEAGYFISGNPGSNEHLLYVVQLEKQAGEWFVAGGYGGDTVTQRGTQMADFNPERGMTGAILARAGYTVDSNRSVAFETAIRTNGHGGWGKVEYSQAFGLQWRLTGGFSLLEGKPTDFLGQYRRNSHATIAVKYSF